MGLFSKIKKGLSKAWSGVKKAVKGVARTVKKVAKKVAYATPMGRKLWDAGSKIGDALSSGWKKVKKGFAKFASKLGPVGMMALSFVLAPVIGPALGAMWSGFGAGAAGMAASANAFVSTLGTIGNGIFAAGNFIGGTLGAMGNAITEGASNVMAGNFSGAANAFATNMSNAFTGKAGMAAVNAGAAQAAASAGTLSNQAASTITDSQVAQMGADGINLASPVNAPIDVSGLTAEQLANQQALGIAPGQVAQTAADAALTSSPVGMDFTGMTADQIANNQAMGSLSTSALDAQVSQYGMTAAQMNAIPNAANAYVTNGIDGAIGVAKMNQSVPTNSGTSEALKRAQQAKSLLGGSGAPDGYQPYTAKAIQAQGVPKVGGVSGQGSSGFSLLGGVQGLEQSIRNSQNMMFG